jgi:TolB-like protein
LEEEAMSTPSFGRSFRSNQAGKIVSRLLTAFLISSLLWQPTLAYEQEVKQLSIQMAEAITKSGKKSVAVVDFTDLQGNVTELGRFLAEEFSVALAMAAKDFQVIDRTNLKTVLQEHKLASTGIIDPQTARKVGEITGVQALVSGTTTPFGDSVRLSVKVLDAATARVIGGFTADIPRTKAIEELLAKGISSTTSTTASQTTAPVPVGSGTSAPRAASQKEDDFSFELKSCQWSGTTIVCKLLITNEGDDRYLTIGARSGYIGFTFVTSSRAFDQAGNEYQAARIRLGNKEDERAAASLLVSGVPTNAILTFEKVSADAGRVTLLEIGCFRQKDQQGKVFAVQMRNIPLGRQ